MKKFSSRKLADSYKNIKTEVGVIHPLILHMPMYGIPPEICDIFTKCKNFILKRSLIFSPVFMNESLHNPNQIIFVSKVLPRLFDFNTFFQMNFLSKTKVVPNQYILYTRIH